MSSSERQRSRRRTRTLFVDVYKRQCMYGKEKCAYSVAIKALKEIQQYRELEKRLTGMFSGELSLETVVDELERQLKEPNNPHPINAKILTYEDAAAWDAYHAIGTPEECQAAM